MAGFGVAIALTRTEVFTACQALADADRVLVRFGATREAADLADLFDLLEHRLTTTRPDTG